MVNAVGVTPFEPEGAGHNRIPGRSISDLGGATPTKRSTKPLQQYSLLKLNSVLQKETAAVANVMGNSALDGVLVVEIGERRVVPDTAFRDDPGSIGADRRDW